MVMSGPGGEGWAQAASLGLLWAEPELGSTHPACVFGASLEDKDRRTRLCGPAAPPTLWVCSQPLYLSLPFSFKI